LGVTFASGYLAGVFCAVVSHPADTMVSKLNKESSSASVGASVKKIYGEIGFNGLWKGLGTRIFMIGTLTGF
jgi:solute carrier family 25 phosphate transporter 3